jgi:hypothetical protein
MMKRLMVVTLLGGVAFLLGCKEPFQPFVLAGPQNSCTIIIAAAPGSEERAGKAPDWRGSLRGHAAAELRHYLVRILGQPGVTIDIRDDSQPVSGNLIFLGRPGAKSPFAGAARRLARKWRPAAMQGETIRIDAWNEKERQVLAITTADDRNLLRAVHAFLDEQGVRYFLPGKGGESILAKRQIDVLQPEILIHSGLALRGFYPGCPAVQLVPPDSSWLVWMARQGFTHVPMAWAEDQPALERWGVQGVAAADPGPLWRPGFCPSNEASVQSLLQGLFTGNPAAGLFLLDARRATPFCNCAKCQSLGSENDRWLHLLTRLGEEMAERKKTGALPPAAALLAVNGLGLPEKYDSSKWPREQILLAARMQPRCYNHALADPLCLEANARVLAGLLQWIAAHPFARLAVVEGYNAPDFAGMPLVLDRVIVRDLEFYQHLGLEGFFCAAPTPVKPGVQSYQNYLLAQAALHPRLDADSLRRSFVSFAYPGAATMTLEYFDMLAEAFANISAWREELPERVRLLEREGFISPLLPLERFHNHFTLYQDFRGSDEGVAWERTFQLVHDARHVMDEMLEEELPDATLVRLLEADKQLRFAELTVIFYDNLIRSLTLGEDEPAMREEAAIRLRQVVKRMEEFRIAEGVCGPGSALSYSGLEESARALLLRLQERYGLPYERVYLE